MKYIIEIPDDWGMAEREALREEVQSLIMRIENIRRVRRKYHGAAVPE